jgi:nicotinamidase-related amidase
MNENTALLIIDVQLGMFDESYPIYEGSALVDNVNSLVNQARVHNIPIIFIQHNGVEDEDPLKSGSSGWSIHPAIKTTKQDKVIQKYHPDSFQETNLKNELDLMGINQLIIAGLQTEFCVDTTCRRAYSLGYNVTLVQDVHSTFDTEVLKAPQIIAHHNQVLNSGFVTLKTVSEVQF